ncbi:cation:proton antiporter [bacterium]|nr:cation:proton antiporter [bacterium]MBU1634669.1 cation:proton antiporter [bacterium]MBU1872358.1 cation:proton antiporter [bacterium]
MNLSPGILLLFGIGVFGGIMSALLVKRLSIPQVLGYILMGVIIGVSGLKLVSQSDIEMLKPFNFFALGIIGFLVGSEIHFETLRKYGKQFTSILLAEGVLAFVLVCLPVTLIMMKVTQSFNIALATGIVFGAIASATDPASTINVLWEYRTAGILTTTIIAIVALDDALAMTLYGIGTSIAEIISGTGSNVFLEILYTLFELFGSIGLGIMAGLFLNFILRRSHDQDYISTVAIGVLLLCIGFAVRMNMDVILVTMSIGITVVNMSPHRSKELINHLKRFSTPIYILFFVFVGARLGLTNMPKWLWLIVAVYVIGRSTGKVFGAWLGAKLTNADDVVRKYTGMGLFAQGGVAIGLSIMASQHLNGIYIAENLYLGDIIIFGITATTFIVQIIGPPLVKLAVKLSGEIGRDITEEDIIKKWKVADVMVRDVPTISESESVRSVFIKFQNTGYAFLPVITAENTIAGIVSFDQIKDVMLDDSCWDWLLASDIMVAAHEIIPEDEALDEALNIMNQLFSDHMPVVQSNDNNTFRGILDRRIIKQSVNKEMIAIAGHTNR